MVPTIEGPAPAQTRYQSHLELARLPYFEVEGGRLRLADPTLGPAIDVHTHLALSYLRPRSVDLERLHDRTLHYLEESRPVDLDLYANQNFSPRDLDAMKRDLILGCLVGGRSRRTHTAPNLLREMRDLRIARAVLLPIDLPAISDNARDYLHLARRHPEFVCFASVHPMSLGLERRLDAQIALGARGLKLHPATQMIRPDHPRAMHLYRLCGDRGLCVTFHCGPVGIEPEPGRRRCQVRLYERPIAEHPGTIFVLGHSGALQFDEALDLARRYPNVWLETASQSLTNVRRMVFEAPEDRVLFGSDWPFYSQAMALAKVFIATHGDERARRRLLWENAARLFHLAAGGTPP